jgi:hypothetical protein
MHYINEGHTDCVMKKTEQKKSMSFSMERQLVIHLTPEMEDLKG